MHKLNCIVLSALIGVITFSGGVHAQNVHFFNNQDLNKESLIDALKPRNAPPETTPSSESTSRSRGISLNETKPDSKLECAYYRKNSRGIHLAEDSGAVALQLTFANNSAELTPESKKSLATLGEALRSEQLKQCCFRVEGHTDARGADAYNLKLSDRRAQSVATYLAKGFAIDKDRLLAVGYGKTKPLADNDSEEGRQKNRRVQITNLGYAQQASE